MPEEWLEKCKRKKWVEKEVKDVLDMITQEDESITP